MNNSEITWVVDTPIINIANFNFLLILTKICIICPVINLCFVFHNRGGAPSFIQKPAIRQADGGKKIIFECKIAADPQPVCTWFRDDIQLSDGGKYLKNGRNKM